MLRILQLCNPASVRAGLRILIGMIVLPAVLLTLAAPNVACMVNIRAEESQASSETEVEAEELGEEAMLTNERQARSLTNSFARWSDALNSLRTLVCRKLNATKQFKGHRLANDLLAPMTC